MSKRRFPDHNPPYLFKSPNVFLHQNDTAKPSYSKPQSAVNNRFQEACENCTQLKVKCDTEQSCRSCVSLNISCSFNKSSSRRAPNNKLVEEIKRQRTEETLPPKISRIDSQSGPSAESICPMPVLELLFDDYFTFIHPLIPLPHEPTFRLQLRRRADLHDHNFLAIMAGMLAALVALYPRRPRQLLASWGLSKRYPNADTFIETCVKTAEEARGASHLYKDPNIFTALVSYLLCVTQVSNYEVHKGKLMFEECVLILRHLHLNTAPKDDSIMGGTDSSGSNSGLNSARKPVDYIERELGRRLFWIVYVGNQHIGVFSGDDSQLMMPFTAAKPPPPFPLDLDDKYISQSYIAQLPPGAPPSGLTGFNANVALADALNDLTLHEFVETMTGVQDPVPKKSVISKALDRVKGVAATLPQELALRPLPHDRIAPDQIRYEVQKANIHCTQLLHRSLLMEKYQAACKIQRQQQQRSMNQQQNDGSRMSEEMRQYTSRADGRYVEEESNNIVKDLATLLSSVNQISMEPNGSAFCHKVRYIITTLNSTFSDVPSTTHSSQVLQQYLPEFLEILIKLERIGDVTGEEIVISKSNTGAGAALPSPASSDVGTTISVEEADERELVRWASLKVHQEKFIKRNGFLTL